MIQETCATLEWRILKVAALSAAVAAVPFPGLSMCVNIALLVGEVQHYKEQLELDDHSLWELAPKLNKTKDIIKKHLVDFILYKIDVKEFVLQKLKAYVPQTVVEVFRNIPVVGTVWGSRYAFKMTRRTLEACLSDLKEIALMMQEEK